MGSDLMSTTGLQFWLGSSSILGEVVTWSVCRESLPVPMLGLDLFDIANVPKGLSTGWNSAFEVPSPTSPRDNTLLPRRRNRNGCGRHPAPQDQPDSVASSATRDDD